MDKKTIVDRLYDEFTEIIAYFEEQQEVSFLNTVNSNFAKLLLMATASHFENRITTGISEFVRSISQKNLLVVQFLENKAIKRQYHTYFNWKENNANNFFGLFGKEFKEFMKSEIKNDDELDKGIKAFLEIGRERNRLVHEDFGISRLEKDTKELYELYKFASYFVDVFPDKLNQFSQS